MADRAFPEAQHTKHKPGGEKPGYIKSSNSQLGHEDHDRMPHPFHQSNPNDETSEGKDH